MTTGRWVLRGGTVIQPRDGTAALTDVLVDGDRIIEVGPRLAVDASAPVVDATGSFIVPGFEELHAHPL